MNQIKVLLVEDDPVWSQGISDYINKQSDMCIVGIAVTKEEAVGLTRNVPVDVVLLDIMLTANNLDGLDAALEISQLGISRIIMLTSLSLKDVIIEAFTAGAMNYINKSNYIEIPDAIRAAYHNESSIHSSAAGVLRNEFNRMKSEQSSKLLTATEKKILQRIDKGETQSQIADKIDLAQQTIKNHINRILKKMNVSSSKEAAIKARKWKMF